MMRSRRAISIIELLVVMSAATVVLTLTSVLIVRAMRTQMQSRAYCDAERNAQRLSEQFRRDVHEAHTATLSQTDLQKDTFLHLEIPNGRTVEYSREGGTVLRLASADGVHVSREEFAFSAGCKSEVRQLDSPRRILLTLTSGRELTAPAESKLPLRTIVVPVSLHVEAVLGRELRFDAKSDVKEDSK